MIKTMNREQIKKALHIPVGYNRKTIYIYFYIGLIAAILLRATLLLNFVSIEMGKIAWYLGVIGYIVFFMHRNRVAERRGKVIKNLNLLEKIENDMPLDEVDFEGLRYILWSISVSKERVNIFFIQLFSFIGLLIALIIEIYS